MAGNPFQPPPPRNPAEQVIREHVGSAYGDYHEAIRLASVHALIELTRAINRLADALDRQEGRS